MPTKDGFAGRVRLGAFELDLQSGQLCPVGAMASAFDFGTGCSFLDDTCLKRCISSIRRESARRFVEPRRTKTPSSGPGAIEMVWTDRTRIDLDSNDMGLQAGDDLDGRDEFRGDVVSDEVRRTFLFLQDVRETVDCFRAVLDSNKQSASGGIWGHDV